MLDVDVQTFGFKQEFPFVVKIIFWIIFLQMLTYQNQNSKE